MTFQRWFHTLNNIIYEYFAFHGKRNFKKVVKGMDFEIERLSWIIQVGPIFHFHLECKRNAKSESERCDGRRETF
jgi:hypothetical protein